MGYVFEFSDANAYENWLKQDRNQAIVRLEHRLMLEMIKPVVGDSLVDIGCGTGASLEPFLGKGISLTGVDPSPYMLDVARKKIGSRADFHQAHAEDLPFDDNSFQYATLCLTLEFCDDPKKALEEACRVAKDGVFIGILNKYALTALKRRIRGIFQTTIYNRARFFSVGEVKQMLLSILGNAPMTSRTVCQFPGPAHPWVNRLESSRFMQRSPFGAFAGIMAVPVARFRTIPLTLASPVNKTIPSGSPAASCAGELKKNYKLRIKN
jgi:ubiquinone/menaquinone biosynthesis C-methylase UbiE